MLVKERKKKFCSFEFAQKPLFRFDSNGEYITENEELIKKLKSRFDHVQILEEVIPFIEEIKEEIEKPKKVIICKQCGAIFDNIGLLLAHARKEHKK